MPTMPISFLYIYKEEMTPIYKQYLYICDDSSPWYYHIKNSYWFGIVYLHMVSKDWHFDFADMTGTDNDYIYGTFLILCRYKILSSKRHVRYFSFTSTYSQSLGNA